MDIRHVEGGLIIDPDQQILPTKLTAGYSWAVRSERSKEEAIRRHQWPIHKLEVPT